MVTTRLFLVCSKCRMEVIQINNVTIYYVDDIVICIEHHSQRETPLAGVIAVCSRSHYS